MGGDARTEKVSDLIEEGVLVVNDGYRAKNEELCGAGLPFARAGNINAGFNFEGADRFSEERLDRVGEKVSRPGDVVFTSKGTVGRFAFVGEDTPRFVYSPQLCFWRALDSAQIHPRWLFYWMQSHEFRHQYLAVSGQTDMAAYVNLRDQRSMWVRIPQLAEQRAIAHILGTLDDKIELNRRMSETLEAMARALFKSWFVDFDPVRAKAEGRDPGLPKPLADLFPDAFEDSELGEIPKGWGVTALGEIVDTVKGRSYKSKELVESDTALVTLKSFARGGGYRPDGLKPFVGSYKPEQVVDPGEVVFACTDVTQAADVIGRAAIVRGTGGYRRLVASLDTLIVRPRDRRMTRAFLYFLGRAEPFVNHTFAHTTGTTVLHLAKNAVPSFRFACPAEQLMQTFDALAAPVLARVQSLEEEAATLAAVRETLLPKLISGELRVTDLATFLHKRGMDI